MLKEPDQSGTGQKISNETDNLIIEIEYIYPFHEGHFVVAILLKYKIWNLCSAYEFIKINVYVRVSIGVEFITESVDWFRIENHWSKF